MDLAHLHLGEFVVNHWALNAAFLVTLLLLVGGELRRSVTGVPQVGPAAAIALINQKDAVILDVREEAEVKAGYIANAVHIPLKQLAARIGQLGQEHERPVLAYCRSGHRSQSAAALLRKQGFTQVHNLAGGIQAWESANLPLKRSKK